MGANGGFLLKQLILECDLGNSRFKWRLLQDGEAKLRGSGDYAALDLSGLGQIGRLDRIRVASVASPERLSQFCDAIPGCSSTAPEVAESQRLTAGVSNGYGENYPCLGVDRWSAVVAAFQRCRGAVLVIDAGSALTADLVDADGNHQGGYIVPGVRLMRSSLYGDTEQVKFDLDTQNIALDFGDSTQQAVDAGVLAAQVGLVSVAIEQANRRIPQGFAILVTGGGASQLLPFLPERAEFASDLVLDGLKWLLP